MTYVLKMSEPQRDYFQIGHVCHKVAELSAEWCKDECFRSKVRSYYYSDYGTDLRKLKPEDIPVDEFVHSIVKVKDFLKDTMYRNTTVLNKFIDKHLDIGDYELVSVPDKKEYDRFFEMSISEYGVTSVKTIEETRRIMNRFYNWADFSVLPGEIMVAERKIAFNKDWGLTSFFSKDAYWRGIIDNMLYQVYDKHITITDYKSSRKMLNKEDLKSDLQLRSYVRMIILLLGRENVKKVTIRLVYMRFSECISHTFDNIDEIVDNTGTWIEETINRIYEFGDDKSKYQPKRNFNCSTCHIKEDGLCPLFKIKELSEGTTLSVSNEESCEEAYRRVEALENEAKALKGACKEFIENTDAIVSIDGAVLDKHKDPKRKYKTHNVVELALRQGVKLPEILDYLSISKTSFEKLVNSHHLKIPKNGGEGELFEVKNSTKFAALVPEESDQLLKH